MVLCSRASTTHPRGRQKGTLVFKCPRCGGIKMHFTLKKEPLRFFSWVKMDFCYANSISSSGPTRKFREIHPLWRTCPLKPRETLAREAKVHGNRPSRK